MVDAVVLDVNETLFALDPIGAAFEEVGLGAGQLPLWFARVLRDGFAAAASGGFVAFPDLARHHTRVLLDRAPHPGVADEARVEQVVAAFDAVRAHPDVAEGLTTLRDAGVRLVTFTNGSAPVVARFLARAGLDGLVDEALDVGIAGRWKPHPDSYAWVCDHLGVAPTRAAMLAVHPWDVAGAMATGMVGAWVDRDGARWPPWMPPADVAGPSLPAVAEVLVDR